MVGLESYDCSGLIVSTLIKLGIIKANQDYTADSLYSSLCSPIEKAELKQGDLCFIRQTK